MPHLSPQSLRACAHTAALLEGGGGGRERLLRRSANGYRFLLGQGGRGGGACEAGGGRRGRRTVRAARMAAHPMARAGGYRLWPGTPWPGQAHPAVHVTRMFPTAEGRPHIGSPLLVSLSLSSTALSLAPAHGRSQRDVASRQRGLCTDGASARPFLALGLRNAEFMART